MKERSISAYAREIRPLLPEGSFAPALGRLWWLPVHLSVLVSGTLAQTYQSLPLLRALRALHRSARVYETRTTLVDPKTGRRWQTLAARPV